jgi:hypothetical protein
MSSMYKSYYINISNLTLTIAVFIHRVCNYVKGQLLYLSLAHDMSGSGSD